MHHGSHHPGVAGSELTRLLARLSDAPPPARRAALAERLGQWLGWTGAIALANVLPNALPPTPPAAAPLRRSPGASAEEADFLRVRAGLQAAIAAGPSEPASSPADFGPHRRHCAALQQAMQDEIGALRLRLRQALARRSAAGARLAAIDAVMDQALAAQERSLLGAVPHRLQAHFERLHAEAGDADAATAAFREDMNQVLQAELAHRLLPAQGLLDTLCTPPSP